MKRKTNNQRTFMRTNPMDRLVPAIINVASAQAGAIAANAASHHISAAKPMHGVIMQGLHLATELFVENDYARSAAAGVGAAGAMITAKQALNPALKTNLGLGAVETSTDWENISDEIEDVTDFAGIEGIDDEDEEIAALLQEADDLAGEAKDMGEEPAPFQTNGLLG